MSQEPVYTAKGALLFFGVCLFLMGIGGTVLYISGEEKLACTREASRRPMCRLTRRVGPVVVRDRDLGVVVDAVLQEAGGGTSRSGGIQRIGRPSFFVEYLAADGVFSGKASPDRDAHEEVRAALVSFVSDPAQDTLSRTLPANSSWIAWVVFGIGTSMVLLWGVGFVFPSTRSRPER